MEGTQTDTPLPIRLGRELRGVREALGLSQRDVARLAGLTPGRIGQIEATGPRTLRTITRLVEAMGAELQIAILPPQG